jgi:hypothetical protein
MLIQHSLLGDRPTAQHRRVREWKQRIRGTADAVGAGRLRGARSAFPTEGRMGVRQLLRRLLDPTGGAAP